MQEMAPRFSKFSRGGGGGGGGGGRHGPGSPLANSLAALGPAPRIITLQSIFETWQACSSLWQWSKKDYKRQMIILFLKEQS